MLKVILKRLYHLLPKQIQDDYHYYRIMKQTHKENMSRDSIFHQWNKAGNPLPAPNCVKQAEVSKIQKKHNCDILVETGTFIGEMIDFQKNNFKQIYSIELSPFLCKKAKRRFRDYKHIEIIEGDSGKQMPKLLSRIDKKVLFWLDGHYSTGITALGDKECPIYEELKSIFNSNLNLYDSIILIDDARLFIGENDYPTIDELKFFIWQFNSKYKIEIDVDIIRLYQ